MPLSKNKIKQINQLSTKKGREREGVFVAEGTKLVMELSGNFKAKIIVATQEWIDQYRIIAEEVITLERTDEMKNISSLTTPTEVLVVFYQAEKQDIDCILDTKQLILMLDTVQDPGNMGTIIRTADWFGIRHIICSEETADIYNPKVVQSTMGALGRVTIHYTALPSAIRQFTDYGWPIYGTFLDGENIYQTTLANYGVIVMGNEGNGISEEVARLINNHLLIPPYPTNANTVESLNVSIATAIVCSEFRRRD